jgi:hypothetical protein
LQCGDWSPLWIFKIAKESGDQFPHSKGGSLRSIRSMRQSLYILVAMCSLLLTSQGRGEEHACGVGCPDDYDRKPCPRIPLLRWCGCDDYCRKPGPWVPFLRWCGCDDYCRKPWPVLDCPSSPFPYSCGVPASRCK